MSDDGTSGGYCELRCLEPTARAAEGSARRCRPKVKLRLSAESARSAGTA